MFKKKQNTVVNFTHKKSLLWFKKKNAHTNLSPPNLDTNTEIRAIRKTVALHLLKRGLFLLVGSGLWGDRN